MTERSLKVLSNGQHMGSLTETDGVWSFGYAPEWLSFDQRFELAPAFPLNEKVVIDGSSQRPVQWFFDNLLPEEAMRIALAKEAKLESEDSWGLLAYYGRESAGSLTLLPPGEGDDAGGRRALPYDVLEARIQAMPSAPITADAPKRMSAAGAQQKLLVILDAEHDNQLFEPEGNEPSTHILKPDMRHTGYPHSAVNEFYTMRLARAVGLPVPNTYLLRVPSACYVVERFDRNLKKSPVQRIHTLDALQLLSRDRTFKYHSANAESLSACIEHQTARALSRNAIYRWAVFNVLVGNGDNHLKNVSFFSQPGGYGLAPFYDLLSTVAYHTPENYGWSQWPNVELAMRIGTATHFDDVIVKVREQAEPLRAAIERAHNLSGGEARLLRMIVNMPIKEMTIRLGGGQ
ncbi:HipA domain-containing protein [Pandoraea pulmonicola]|uniref:Serine/threonine-protein kinase HipA n=1 Tax=Pandoraea pulmonicola TaxID=93221 RepID=A0AAJ4Z8Z8_PANPU|nr:HipA domain-containing protein [Pandoraea pulmonicola]AJC22036.1 toxin HipA [Pandoraea pulmonicola]SUA88982.1 Serine/threonine-protein kinase HipA [Pandoraea pulmonicola]